jgi:protocatechuate 3,4-dioxygenase beta subunit
VTLLAACSGGTATPSPLPDPTATLAPTATSMPPGSRAVSPGALAEGCVPTPDDGPGPNYEPGAPERESVGTGYVLTGSVVESGSCAPIEGALVELWMAGPGGAYGPDWRASLTTDAAGNFTFESHPPQGYGGAEGHIHIRLSSPRHSELFLVHVPPEGASAGEVAAVLRTE